ncbi:MAG: trans-AT polyketide synthase/acyltransferase/oxidoreductase domain-containing protein [Alteromonadaceae bacterium]|jgi:trans-AT polyketide synthase/acyltransferase/oxidoreductase domain-containing protein
MTTCIFPGQGSQKAGMWNSLFSAYPQYIEIADEVLGYSIEQLCSDDRYHQLTATQYTQPALFTVCVLSYLEHLKSHSQPDHVMGHSLGEYAALYVAGVIGFADGLRLVQKRGELMAKTTQGGMAAVIGLSAEQVADICHQQALHSIDIANINSYSQIVIAGPKDDILAARAVFESQGSKMYIPLKVSGAFHSRYMNEAMQQFSAYVATVDFKTPSIPVIANVTAKPYVLSEVRNNITEQMVQGVRWVQSIEYMSRLGETSFIEVGPGQVLTQLTHDILSTNRRAA